MSKKLSASRSTVIFFKKNLKHERECAGCFWFQFGNKLETSWDGHSLPLWMPLFCQYYTSWFTDLWLHQDHQRTWDPNLLHTFLKRKQMCPPFELKKSVKNIKSFTSEILIQQKMSLLFSLSANTCSNVCCYFQVLEQGECPNLFAKDSRLILVIINNAVI